MVNRHTERIVSISSLELRMNRLGLFFIILFINIITIKSRTIRTKVDIKLKSDSRSKQIFN